MSNILLQCLLGIECNDFAMIAADQINTQSVMVMKQDEQKIFQLSDKLIMGVNGDNGDSSQFSQFVAKNIQLYKMRNGYQLDTAACVHFTRRSLAEGLRNGNGFMVNLLIGGYDEVGGGQLYYMDYLSSCLKVPFATHGFGGMMGIGIMDQYHQPSMTEKEGYDLLQTCVHEVQKRLFVNLPKFQVTVVDKFGVRRLPTICPLSLKEENNVTFEGTS